METIDWNAVREEVTGFLQDLIRLDTTNPPGNEILCANYIAAVLRNEGFEPVLTESDPGRGNVTARLSGGDKLPLMLLGHTDVVAAEPEKWTCPPLLDKRGQSSNGVGRSANDRRLKRPRRARSSSALITAVGSCTLTLF